MSRGCSGLLLFRSAAISLFREGQHCQMRRLLDSRHHESLPTPPLSALNPPPDASHSPTQDKSHVEGASTSSPKPPATWLTNPSLPTTSLAQSPSPGHPLHRPSLRLFDWHRIWILLLLVESLGNKGLAGFTKQALPRECTPHHVRPIPQRPLEGAWLGPCGIIRCLQARWKTFVYFEHAWSRNRGCASIPLATSVRSPGHDDRMFTSISQFC